MWNREEEYREKMRSKLRKLEPYILKAVRLMENFTKKCLLTLSLDYTIIVVASLSVHVCGVNVYKNSLNSVLASIARYIYLDNCVQAGGL